MPERSRAGKRTGGGTASGTSRRRSVSAGLVLYRRGPRGGEIFLAPPGGPFWAARDAGAWTIP